MPQLKPCPSGTPSWFTGHWRDWHRGHGCDQDDGKPRSEAAIAEIAQHEANRDTGYLTDAELNLLRASTTSGDTLRVRALDELKARRAEHEPLTVNLHRARQRIDAESKVNALFAETAGKALGEQLSTAAERDRLRDGLVEALDLLDAVWCPEHGHAPRPEQFARVAALRELVKSTNWMIPGPSSSSAPVDPGPEHTQHCGQCGWSGTDDDYHACPGLPGENTF